MNNSNCEKKQVTIVLPYMGMISTELKVNLHKTFKQLLPAYDLRVTFKFPNTSRIISILKTKLSENNILYKYSQMR